MDTKHIISNAYISLLDEHPSSEITVKKILERAHVSRPTFYRHFRDIFDLSTWVYEEYMDQQIANGKIESLEENLCAALGFLSQNKAYFRKVIKDSRGNALFEFLCSSTRNFEIQLCQDAVGRLELTDRELMEIEIYTYGSSKVVCDWISNGCKMPHEQVTEVLVHSMPSVVRDAVRKTK